MLRLEDRLLPFDKAGDELEVDVHGLSKGHDLLRFPSLNGHSILAPTGPRVNRRKEPPRAVARIGSTWWP
jgi:hypothetical protein